MCVLGVFYLLVPMGPLGLVGCTTSVVPEEGDIVTAGGKSPGFWGRAEPSTPPCVSGGLVEKRHRPEKFMGR